MFVTHSKGKEESSANESSVSQSAESSDKAKDDSSSSGHVTSMKDLEGILTTGYAGTPEDDDGSAILLAMNDEGTFSGLESSDKGSKSKGCESPQGLGKSSKGY